MDRVYRARAGGRKGIDCRGFLTMCRQADLYDCNFSEKDAVAIFEQILPIAKCRLDLPRFHEAMRIVAQRKGVEESELHRAFGGPELQQNPSLAEPPRTNLASEDKTKPNLANPRQASIGKSPSCPVLQLPSSCPSFQMPRFALPETLPAPASRSAVMADSARGGLGTGRSSVSLCEAMPSLLTARKEMDAIQEIFGKFCFASAEMDSKGFVRMCKEARLIDKRFSTQDARLVFGESVPVTVRYMDFQCFTVALRSVAARKGMDETQLHHIIGTASNFDVDGPQVEASTDRVETTSPEVPLSCRARMPEPVSRLPSTYAGHSSLPLNQMRRSSFSGAFEPSHDVIGYASANAVAKTTNTHTIDLWRTGCLENAFPTRGKPLESGHEMLGKSLLRPSRSCGFLPSTFAGHSQISLVQTISAQEATKPAMELDIDSRTEMCLNLKQKPLGSADVIEAN